MASDRIINNLNSVISTKNEIKGILRDNGIDPGDVFSDYPNMIRSIVGGGSMSGDTVNSYISAYLDSYNFIDQNELSTNSYVTSDVLSAQSYITLADVPTIDENIIPKETGTYTLGDSTYLYSNVYGSSLNVGNNSRVYNDNGGITLSINNNAGVRLGSSNLYPKTTGAFSLGTSSNFWDATYTNSICVRDNGNGFYNVSERQINIKITGNWRYTLHQNFFGPGYDNQRDLGSSDARWKSTYTYNLYADNTYSTRYNFTYNTWVGSDSDYEFHIGVNNQKRFQCNMYQFYAITNPDNSSLGVPNYPWAYTYTKFLIGQNANISNSAYLPVNTYWYDGTTYHWLGSLFN